MSSFQAPGDFSLSESVGKRVMTPGGAVAPGVAPELMPVLVLENDRAENMLLSGQRMFGRASSIAAGGAGTRATLRVVNNRPDQLVTVEYFTAQVNFLIAIERGSLGAVPFGSQLQGLPRDSRIAGPNSALGPSSSTLLITDNTLLAPTVFVGQGIANAVYTPPLVLAPGDILVFAASADASPLNGYCIAWRERRLNQSERL